MEKFGIIVTLALLLFAISEISAICCGRGKHGFCNDCVKVGLFRGRKCCGAGSGYGSGCNIFCCGCGKCRNGHPTIAYQSGWLLHKHYTCRHKRYDAESISTFSLQDTLDVFNKIDQNDDSSIAPDEFLHALRLRLFDDQNAHIMASQLLDSENLDEIGSFLDAVNDKEMDKDVEEDFARMVADEFKKLDNDGDGLIQPGEFDKDLRDESQKNKKKEKSDLVRDLISKLE